MKASSDLKEMYDSIEFTVEHEKEGKLPFVDILITRQEDGGLGRPVYQKERHTGLYLYNLSHHHPAQKRGDMLTLLERAHRIADGETLSDE